MYIEATIKNEENRNRCQTSTALIDAREIWTRANKAAARKATAEGVNSIAAEAKPDGSLFIYQISGYTRERGLFYDFLNNAGQRIDSNGRVIAL